MARLVLFVLLAAGGFAFGKGWISIPEPQPVQEQPKSFLGQLFAEQPPMKEEPVAVATAQLQSWALTDDGLCVIAVLAIVVVVFAVAKLAL